jgi:hypothetical protein
VPADGQLQVPGGGPIVVGVRPEDLMLEAASNGAAGGVPARIEHLVDLGHYRRATLRAAEHSLLAFVPKSEPIPTDGLVLRPRRLLVYAGEQLAGVIELAPGAAQARSGVG